MAKEIIKVQNLTLGISKEQQKTIARRTPKEFIKTRPGPNGISLNYVEGGYIERELDEIFNHMWDFRIIDKEVGKLQIWVQGQLTCKIATPFGPQEITKSQFGGAKIKKDRVTGEAINIANDLKAAATDSLKKCASLLGIAADVYGGEEYIDDNEAPIITTEPVIEQYGATTIINKTPAETITCSLHNRQARLYTKNDKSWYGHKLDDGTWCNTFL